MTEASGRHERADGATTREQNACSGEPNERHRLYSAADGGEQCVSSPNGYELKPTLKGVGIFVDFIPHISNSSPTAGISGGAQPLGLEFGSVRKNGRRPLYRNCSNLQLTQTANSCNAACQRVHAKDGRESGACVIFVSALNDISLFWNDIYGTTSFSFGNQTQTAMLDDAPRCFRSLPLLISRSDRPRLRRGEMDGSE